MYNHDGYSEVPEETLETLDRYAQAGAPPGSFIAAVLENNLHLAAARADPKNRAQLIEIVRYAYSELPARCWGSKEKVREWYSFVEEKVEEGDFYD